ncbi:MAG TPA: hypothetical protein VM032_19775 [Vicinamibacterales bacterium]|nr:hypothetical protein [Vicinamibacterales bacterium]
MTRWTVARLCVAMALAGGALPSAQGLQLPSEPGGKFGRSITGSYEGWYDNKDGSHVFLVGYYNRNLAQEVDIPIGPNNRIEPGGPDFGQPTHFLPGRQVGVFTVTVPREFTQQQRLTWTIVDNGVTTAIPLRMNTDYNISPFEDAAVGNTPPVLKFEEAGSGIQGPVAAIARALPRSAAVNTPLELPLWATDDAKYTSGTNAPMRNPRPPVTAIWSKYRGPGKVTFVPADGRPKFEILSGGQVGQAYSGRSSVTATFSDPGEYILHVVGNDFSGPGGGGEVCCWTTVMLKVSVK